jgi:hypothetical protein
MEARSLTLLSETDLTEMVHDVRNASATWLATAPVSLGDSQILVAFADLRSDLRLLARIVLDPLRVATREITVPMAFLDSNVASSELLAFRETFGGTLVKYRWQWSDPPTNHR